MKSLYLLRHAKSSWADPGLEDRHRPLNKRGQRDAPEMGSRFGARGERLERVISSPAKRALTTARLFCEACGFPADRIETEEHLYFLGAGSIRELILAQPDEADSVMLVFHNPDITHFSNSITDGFRIDNVPTSGLVRFASDITSWRDWSGDNTAFGYFDFPKNTGGGVITG